jgi:dihydrofolate reductase
MRRIVMFNRVTADGYFSTPDGGLDWAVPDTALDRSAVGGIPQVDTVLFGRRTYDAFASFWPTVLDDADTAPDPHHAGRRSPELRAMATMLDEARKIVFSRTRPDVTWRNSHLVRELDPQAIDAMKRELGKDMMIFGSGTIVSQLTEHGLIDEYQLVVSPLLLGAGRSFLGAVSHRTPLALVDATPYPSGNVMLRYVRAGA